MKCSEDRKYINNQHSLRGQPAMLLTVKSLIFGVYFCLQFQTSLGNDDRDSDSANIRFQSLSTWLNIQKNCYCLLPPRKLQTFFNDNGNNLSDTNNITY
jgi:hypothetical protein